jgi:hypothetical protein
MKKILILTIGALVFLITSSSFAQQESAGKTLRYFNKTEAGVSFGIGSFQTDIVNGIRKSVRNDEIVIAFQTINGIKYKNKLGLGVSLGIEKWQNGLFWPVSGYLSYDLKPEGNTFFGNIYLGSGIGTRYATSFYEQGKGGFTFSIGLGYKMNVARKLHFMYEIFYKYQSVGSTYIMETINKYDSVIYRSSPIEYKIPLHFAGFKIGICFP